MVWKTGRETRVLQGGLLGREDNCKNFAGLNGSWKKLEIEWKPAIILRKIEKILGRKHIFPLAHAIARFSEINCLFSKRRLLQDVWKHIIKHDLRNAQVYRTPIENKSNQSEHTINMNVRHWNYCNCNYCSYYNELNFHWNQFFFQF